MWAAIEDLDAENLRAWRLLRSLQTRFLVQAQMLAPALMRLTANDDVEEFEDLMTRLSILYDVQCPAKKGEA